MCNKAILKQKTPQKPPKNPSNPQKTKTKENKTKTQNKPKQGNLDNTCILKTGDKLPY